MSILETAIPTAEAASASRRRLTIGLCTNVVAIAFESIAVATAMPVAARELHGLGFYAWAFSLFLIGMLFSTVVAGRLIDRMGPAKPLLVADKPETRMTEFRKAFFSTTYTPGVLNCAMRSPSVDCCRRCRGACRQEA